MRRPARAPTVASTLIVLAIGLSGCFTTAADFRNDAEQFILDDEALRDAIFGDSATVFNAVTCAEPANQNEGTKFRCAATDTDGDSREFEVEITGKTAYEVTLVP